MPDDRSPFDRRAAWLVTWTWGLAATFALLAGVLLLRALRPNGVFDPVTAVCVQAIAFLSVTAFILYLHQRERTTSDALALRPTSLGVVLLAALLGAALQVPANLIDLMIEKRWPTPEDELVQDALFLATDTRGKVVALVVAVACAGPFVEELLFRGAIYGASRQRGTAIDAALATSFVFTTTHFNVRNWPALLPVALVLGYVRTASGSALPGIALHVAFNGVTVAGLALGFASVGTQPALTPAVIAGGSAAVLALLVAIQHVAAGSEACAAARAADEGVP